MTVGGGGRVAPRGATGRRQTCGPPPMETPCGGICASRKGLPGPCSWYAGWKGSRLGERTRQQGRDPESGAAARKRGGGLAPVGGTGGNDGSQPGEAEAFAEGSGWSLHSPVRLPGRRRRSIAYSRLLELGGSDEPHSVHDRGTPETRERNRTGIGGGGPHAAPSTARLCTCVCVRASMRDSVLVRFL